MPEIPQHIFQTFPVLKTQRLRLREILPEDAAQIFSMRINPNVNRFIARMPMGNLQEAEEKVTQVREMFANKQGIGWAALLRNGEKIIGACGFNRIDFYNLRAEIGGEMHPDYWGKNIALEAVTEIVRFGFTEMNLHTIEAWVSPLNRAVIHLLENIGFRKEAHLTDYVLKGEAFSDMAIYSIHPQWFKQLIPRG